MRLTQTVPLQNLTGIDFLCQANKDSRPNALYKLSTLHSIFNIWENDGLVRHIDGKQKKTMYTVYTRCLSLFISLALVWRMQLNFVPSTLWLKM